MFFLPMSNLPQKRGTGAKFKDGKMVERWGSSDELGLLKQIGVIRD
jgi:hypothetical protein